jgi:hypothetical protein
MEPVSVTAARQLIIVYEQQGKCPVIVNTKTHSHWTCHQCDKVMPPTLGDYNGTEYKIRPVRCSFLK